MLFLTKKNKKSSIALMASATALCGALSSLPASAAFVFTEITPNLRNIAGSGTLSTISGADDSVQRPVSIGFTFSFFGTDYTSVGISSNGFINFDTSVSSSGCCQGAQLTTGSSTFLPGPIVAGMWDDLNPSLGGNVYYQSFASEFVVGFYDVPHFGLSAQTSTFEIILRADDNIELQYGTVRDDPSSTSVGFANAANDAGDQLYFGPTPSVLSNRGFATGVAIEPPPPPPPTGVPVPPVLALLGAGLLVMGWRRRSA